MALVEFIKPSYSAVKSINGKIGDVNLTAEDIGAATEDYVIEAIGNIPQPDMSNYATIDNVEDATRGLATEAYVNQKVAEAAVGGDVNLDDYLRKDELGIELDLAVNERGLVNEDRAREIAGEVCDERGTGSGGGVDEETVRSIAGDVTNQKLESEFRYIYNCDRLGPEQDGEWHEIYDGNLMEFIQRRRDNGDRFVLYLEGTPAKVTIEDGYWNEELQEDVPWKLHINWTDTDNIYYSWEIRDIDGLFKYYCHGFNQIEYGVSEDRVNELINEALSAIGVAEEGAY